MKKVTRKVGKYEVGRTIGEGTFAKVKFAHNTETGESVAMKVMAKSTILKHRMVDQVSNFSSFMNLELFCIYCMHVCISLAFHLSFDRQSYSLVIFQLSTVAVCCIFHFPAYLIGFISGNCIDF